MVQYTIPKTGVIALFPLNEFYGYDHPFYLDVLVEFGEDRHRLTNMIANAILQKNWDKPSFNEMVSMQLGYMGFDSDEYMFYGKVQNWLRDICSKCSPRISEPGPTLVEAIEEADHVNIIYLEVGEVQTCNVPPRFGSIS